MQRRPPRRRCAGCGGDVYAWAEGARCARCQAEVAPDRRALVEAVRERRQVTNDEIAELERASGFGDEIPY